MESNRQTERIVSQKVVTHRSKGGRQHIHVETGGGSYPPQ